MKKLVFAIIFTVTAFLPALVFASELSVTASDTSVDTGSSIELGITVSGENIAAVEGVFTYDPSVLTYVSSSGGISDGVISMVSAAKGGASTITGTVNFAASGAGETVINVSIDNAYNYAGEKLEPSSGAVSITVSGTGGSGGSEGGEDGGPVIDISVTGVAAENVEGAQEQMYIWRSLNTLTLPGGYADRQVEYNGEFVGGAAVPDTEKPILLYLSEADGENAGYYVYDENAESLFPYQTITAVRTVYTLMRPDDGSPVPAGFTQTTVTMGKNTYPAWHSESIGSLYLVYAKTASGESGYYLLDAENESVVAYSAPAAEGSEAAEALPAEQPVFAAEPEARQEIKPAAESIGISWFYLVCGACILLLAALVIVVVKIAVQNKGRYRRG